MSRKINKKKARRRKKKNRKSSPIAVRIFSFLILLGLLLFSMGAAGYVIFFRTAIAHGATAEKKQNLDMVFEESYTSVPELPPDIPPVPDSSLPLVAIIIDDMGYHKEIGNKLLALPMNVTFSFLAAAPHTTYLVEKAFRAGRVILLHQPMEPKSKERDPGPGALLIGQSKEEQKRIFYQNIQAVPHAVGVNNHMGSLYTEDRAAMDDLMQLIRAQGLFFIDSVTTAKSQGFAAAIAAGVLTARRHIFLDNVRSQDKVCEQLQKLVKSAEENGWAIGIGHPHEATLAALTNCREKLLKRVRLISVQELLTELNKK
ncbi:MAG TPA: divergent polysaccharide deacetylase family protein [Desulfocapsa sulfexigens]|nr:divergent polysaccharide deacetylase family protein [Desulfocapsa sulfexigens]